MSQRELVERENRSTVDADNPAVVIRQIDDYVIVRSASEKGFGAASGKLALFVDNIKNVTLTDDVRMPKRMAEVVKKYRAARQRRRRDTWRPAWYLRSSFFARGFHRVRAGGLRVRLINHAAETLEPLRTTPFERFFFRLRATIRTAARRK